MRRRRIAWSFAWGVVGALLIRASGLDPWQAVLLFMGVLAVEHSLDESRRP